MDINIRGGVRTMFTGFWIALAIQAIVWVLTWLSKDKITEDPYGDGE